MKICIIESKKRGKRGKGKYKNLPILVHLSTGKLSTKMTQKYDLSQDVPTCYKDRDRISHRILMWM